MIKIKWKTITKRQNNLREVVKEEFKISYIYMNTVTP